MARKTDPVAPPLLAADDKSLLAIQSLPDYQPANPHYSLGNMMQMRGKWSQAVQNRQQLEMALTAARTEEAESSHEYHDIMVGGRTQVLAQYGSDSTAVEKVGLTRTSNRKRPTRRKDDEE